MIPVEIAEDLDDQAAAGFAELEAAWERGEDLEAFIAARRQVTSVAAEQARRRALPKRGAR
jgi:hypothetical protein